MKTIKVLLKTLFNCALIIFVVYSIILKIQGKNIKQEILSWFDSTVTLESVMEEKDMTREEFNRDKLLTSFRRACIKRDVPYAILEKTVSDIEQELLIETDHEVPSQRIGELAMQKLLFIDDVAYVRFASVYKDFKDINAFRAVLESIDNTKNLL